VIRSLPAVTAPPGSAELPTASAALKLPFYSTYQPSSLKKKNKNDAAMSTPRGAHQKKLHSGKNYNKSWGKKAEIFQIFSFDTKMKKNILQQQGRVKVDFHSNRLCFFLFCHSEQKKICLFRFSFLPRDLSWNFPKVGGVKLRHQEPLSPIFGCLVVVWGFV
jgi:hypothetical protein